MPIFSIRRWRLAVLEVNTFGSYVASVRFKVTGSDEIRIPVFVIDKLLQARYVSKRSEFYEGYVQLLPIVAPTSLG